MLPIVKTQSAIGTYVRYEVWAVADKLAKEQIALSGIALFTCVEKCQPSKRCYCLTL
jgi:hypothetical protein